MNDEERYEYQLRHHNFQRAAEIALTRAFNCDHIESAWRILDELFTILRANELGDLADKLAAVANDRNVVPDYDALDGVLYAYQNA